jgi:hypothetical protein
MRCEYTGCFAVATGAVVDPFDGWEVFSCDRHWTPLIDAFHDLGVSLFATPAKARQQAREAGASSSSSIRAGQ